MLPFVEYELHRQLMNNMLAQGKNAIFGLRVDVALGDIFLVGLATGTAFALSCLAPAVNVVPLINLKAPAGKSKGFASWAAQTSRRWSQKDEKSVLAFSPSSASQISEKSGEIGLNDVDLNKDKNTIIVPVSTKF